jgi:hypothetical protein
MGEVGVVGGLGGWRRAEADYHVFDTLHGKGESWHHLRANNLNK